MTIANPPAILVVDDEPDICSNLSDILSDLGYRVDVAYNGVEALKLVRQHSYAVALLDLKMPDMDGLELYRKIKQVQSGTVAIVVTAYAAGETAVQALRAGAWKIVSKPVELDRLLPLVEEATEQPLVMIVDDDPELCDNLWELLRERGFRVQLARDVSQADTLLRKSDFQVVLIDMRLPEGDGSAVFRLVRETNPQAKTILITGYRSETAQLVDQVRAAGADAVCYKPFDVGALLETVDRLSG